ncbi:MAG: nucleoside hydrolase [Armatimonadota bacterium]
MAENIPLLFDTDIGSDIDDAVALAYLLRQPRCELLGITTVTGEAQARARLADAVCRAAGRDDVPIHSGAEEPLLIDQRQPRAPQQTALARWPHRSEFPPNTAVPFLQEVIRSRPGEVTLLAVGPFTNVGLLFALDPEIPRLLKRLVIMGGSYRHGQSGFSRREWNTGCDPHAVARMFQAPVPELAAFGLNVTLQCQLEAEECRRRLRGGVLDVVAEMAVVWFGHRPQITFHDPLAAVALFEPEVCDYARGRVEIDLSNPRTAGVAHWARNAEGPHSVAIAVRPEQFFQRYFEVFS